MRSRQRLGIVSAYPCQTPEWGANRLCSLMNGQTTAPFVVGSQQSFAARPSRLFLRVNDDNYNDHSGSFTARIRVTRANDERGKMINEWKRFISLSSASSIIVWSCARGWVNSRGERGH